jgi:hypothetical protein
MLSRMYIGLHVRYKLLLADFSGTSILSKDFRKKKHSSIKFHENPSSGNRVVPCGLTDRQTRRS